LVFFDTSLQGYSPKVGRLTVKLLDPKNDAVFKLMLVDDDAAEMRISLLSAVLKPDSPITSAIVKNPHMPKKHIRDKDTILDILIELGDGRRIDLEMQMAWKSYIPERAYFYGGKLITSQLNRGQKYQTLKPVSTIFLLNSIGFPDAPPDHAHYIFTMKEQSNLTHIAAYFTMHFVEIPKLIRGLSPGLPVHEDLALVNWCRLLYDPNQPGLDEVFATMPALRKAKKKLEEISADDEKREVARMRERGRRDYESDLEDALCRGREEGKAEGKAEGKLEFLVGLLTNPLTAKLPSKDIAKLCGISVAEVEHVRAKGR
jgi:predicted transposase/invertase (TIGR01784 family)